MQLRCCPGSQSTEPTAPGWRMRAHSAQGAGDSPSTLLYQTSSLTVIIETQTWTGTALQRADCTTYHLMCMCFLLGLKNLIIRYEDIGGTWTLALRPLQENPMKRYRSFQNPIQHCTSLIIEPSLAPAKTMQEDEYRGLHCNYYTTVSFHL